MTPTGHHATYWHHRDRHGDIIEYDGEYGFNRSEQALWNGPLRITRG